MLSDGQLLTSDETTTELVSWDVSFTDVKTFTLPVESLVAISPSKPKTLLSKTELDKLISLSQLKDLSADQKAILHSRIFEIPNNALTHSNSKDGIICHGYYKNKNTFTFSIYDLGIGIPQSVIILKYIIW